MGTSRLSHNGPPSCPVCIFKEDIGEKPAIIILTFMLMNIHNNRQHQGNSAIFRPCPKNCTKNSRKKSPIEVLEDVTTCLFVFEEPVFHIKI